jgi:hypothetical protein
MIPSTLTINIARRLGLKIAFAELALDTADRDRVVPVQPHPKELLLR